MVCIAQLAGEYESFGVALPLALPLGVGEKRKLKRVNDLFFYTKVLYLATDHTSFLASTSQWDDVAKPKHSISKTPESATIIYYYYALQSSRIHH